MGGVLTGFAIIGAIIAAGYVVGASACSARTRSS